MHLYQAVVYYNWKQATDRWEEGTVLLEILSKYRISLRFSQGTLPGHILENMT